MSSRPDNPPLPASQASVGTTTEALASLADEELIERLQRGAFGYFERYANPSNGLVADTSRPNSPCSIAVVGFGLAAYVVAVRRGWLSRADAVARTLATLEFFASSEQGTDPGATGHRGFYYHFLDIERGRRVWDCELSLIDTALLIAGVLTVGQFFDGDGAEARIRTLSTTLYERIDWQWAQNGACTLSQGWKPECGFLHYGWEGYNEATLIYLLGLGSPSHPLSETALATWTTTYQWESLLGTDYLYSGPLFTHLFSHAWIDFRDIRDPFMREKNCDYFENTRRAIEVQRTYAELNAHGFIGYGRDLWGISAGDGPVETGPRRRPRENRFLGYAARGVPYGPDDGTLSPWAMLAALPFEREAALVGTRQLLRTFPQVCVEDRFSSGFNPTLATDSGGWLSPGWYGLDQGLLLVSIENARSDLIWQLLRSSPLLRTGLARAGFSGGWLGA
jgi:hypothetical protein